MDYINLLKKRELDIIKEFHRICEENNLKYILAFGSMIGCVRHRGFIPWDDDIDVVMPYEDFKRLNEIGQRLMGEKYILLNSDTDKDYCFPFSKIQLSSTCAINSLPSKYPWENQGIYIDIFPAMYVPRKGLLKLFINISNGILGQINRAFSMQCVKETKKHKLGKMLLFMCLFLNKLSTNNGRIKRLYRIALLANGKNSDDLYLCDFSQVNMINRFRLGRDAFDNRMLMDFEDTKLYMPRNYDRIMRGFYGDYMMLPDEKDRKTHGFIYVSDTESYKEYALRVSGNN